MKWNLSLRVKLERDISMESFINVHYETTEITFQNRGSDSLLDFEEGHPHIASKISKGWLGEKNAKMQIISKL